MLRHFQNIYYTLHRSNHIYSLLFIVTVLSRIQICESSWPTVEKWPEHYVDEIECARLHDRHLPVPQVPWASGGRAWLTVPPQIEIRPSTVTGDKGMGTFATTFIAVNTWLAEYEGEVFGPSFGHFISLYAWGVFRNDTIAYYVDGALLERSNWLRWVNCARSQQEENVKAVYCYGKVLYITTKPVFPRQELFVYYGEEYAKTLGVNTDLFIGRP